MKPLHIILAVITSLIWGLNFVAAKAGVNYFPTFFFLALRMTIVAAVLVPFLRKISITKIQILKISIVLAVFHFGLMFSALENGLNSSVGVVIDQLRVPFAVAMGYFIFGESIGRKGVFGIFVAIMGTLVIVGTPNVIYNYTAFLMLVGGALSWAFYNIQVKNINNVNVLPFIGWIAIFSVPQLYVISYILEGNNVQLLLDAPAIPLFSLLYVAIAATILAHGSWYFLLQKYSVGTVVPYSLLIPLFGVMFGVVLLGEALTWQLIVGGVITVIGVAIVAIKKPSAAKGGEIT